ncbi:bifunctional Fe-S hydro-lyase [Babesia duncani]|uniref:fumarate hydratase n=1 Tax=Babesia duncani TaxID=323732 RepID=A0AAD9UQ70_9APIC|nr:bifunctional Fe-S hydro-lyase [Babesia duncani]
MTPNGCKNCKFSTGSAGGACIEKTEKSTASDAPAFDTRFVDPLAGGFNGNSMIFDRIDDLSDLLTSVEVQHPFAGDGKLLVIPPELLERLTTRAFVDIMHYLRASHLQQLRNILDDPESSNNDKFVSMQLLKNACVAAGKILPGCQDTGTAIVLGKRGNLIASKEDANAIARGVYNAYVTKKFRYSQMAPLSMYKETNTKCNLPAQIELYSCDGSKFELLFIAKGGGSANKTFLYQQTKAILTEQALTDFLLEHISSIGTSACPPYHLAIVIGGLSAEMTLKTVKLASCHHLDSLPTMGSEFAGAFRDIEMESKILEKTRQIGIGAQFGGKHFCHDVRVIRLPRHGASCPIGIGVSCSADRQIVAKIDPSGVYLERLEHDPAQFLPDISIGTPLEEIKIDLDVGMEKLLETIRQYPVKTRLSLSGTLIVARDIAHARIDEILTKTGDIPAYMKEHPIYYAGPAKRPEGHVSGSFGPTTAGRMDAYAERFMSHGASLITFAKGNRSRAFVAACKKYKGIYLGSVGGPAALISSECIESVQVIDFPDLGMEAVHKIKIKNFPAFVVVDSQGNDLYSQFVP